MRQVPTISTSAVRDGWRDGSALSGAGQDGGPLLPQPVPTVAKGPRHPPGPQRAERAEDPSAARVDGERERGSVSRWGAVPRCLVCATPLPSRRARYCSAACKQRAFRLRRAELADVDTTHLREVLRRRGALFAHTIYACPNCDERFVGERRCGTCNLFCRALGLGGVCQECEQPLLLTELLGLEVMP
jgi:hypothetical protein